MPSFPPFLKHLAACTLALVPVFVMLTGTEAVCAQEPPPSVAFKAVCFDPRETVVPVLYLTHNGKRKPLELDKSRISKRQKASVGKGRLVHFHTSPEPFEGETPAVTLRLPGDTLEHLLFVFVPSKTGFRAWAIQLPVADFKAGDTLLINAAPVEVAVKQAASTPMVVKPGSSRILSIPTDYNEPMLPIQIFEKTSGTPPWRIAQSTRWPVDLRFRTYLFFYHSPESVRLMLHGITERIDED